MDIASMANGLEIRAPFLDHRFVEFAASMPSRLKVRQGKGKWILRRAFKSVLPDVILSRRKRGFTPPIAHWIRGQLKGMIMDLLTDSTAKDRGYFRPDRVKQILHEHLTGVRNHHYHIWNLLMLEMWHRIHVDEARSPNHENSEAFSSVTPTTIVSHRLDREC